jgi:hypothetical protein
MSAITQSIVLRSSQHFGRRVPTQAVGHVLSAVPDAVRMSIRMAIEGRSRARGKRPDWLRAASDIRFVGHDGKDETVLFFEAPSLGDAAPGIYAQKELWPTKPAPSETGFDVLAGVVTDVAAQNADSERFDRPLLDQIAGFKNVLNGTFNELAIVAQQQALQPSAVMTLSIIESARTLYTNIPIPQRVRVVGKLDMVRASTQSFGVILDDGQEVRGVLTVGDIRSISSLLNQRVLVLGKAIYRASGKVLRVDAEEVTAAHENGSFFSSIPAPARKRFDFKETAAAQGQATGIGPIIGKWPGDETDEQIEQALQELS